MNKELIKSKVIELLSEQDITIQEVQDILNELINLTYHLRGLAIARYVDKLNFSNEVLRHNEQIISG